MGSNVSKLGFNIIGHISGNLGLGVAARNLIDLIAAKGFPVATYELDPGFERRGHDERFRQLTVASIEKLPYAINIFVLPPLMLSIVVPKYFDILFRGEHLNVALPFWELAVIPAEWIATLNVFDVIVGVSDFVRHVVEFAVSGPLVIGGALPVNFPTGVTPNRRKFGLPDRAVIFLMSFEPYSDTERKNPWAVIDVFLKSVAHEEQACLVIKINNAKDEAVLAKIRTQCGNHPRIRLITEAMNYAEVLSLYASCDVYVSLHHAEGLGLGMMETMLLSKPVIATAWSGNLTFMDQTNACLVRYRLVPVQSMLDVYTQQFVGKEIYWADPDLEDAAAWMRRLLSDNELRTRIGAKAASDMAEWNVQAQRGHFLDEVVAVFSHRSFLSHESRLPAAIELFQVLLARRDSKIDQLQSDLNWILNKRLYKFVRKAKSILGGGGR